MLNIYQKYLNEYVIRLTNSCEGFAELYNSFYDFTQKIFKDIRDGIRPKYTFHKYLLNVTKAANEIICIGSQIRESLMEFQLEYSWDFMDTVIQAMCCNASISSDIHTIDNAIEYARQVLYTINQLFVKGY